MEISESYTNMKSSQFSAGDWVEVLSKEEILRTLDKKGQLDGMPFMPEMLAFCGKQFKVFKRAHKTCDTVFPIRGRRVRHSVHLDTRCDGSGHDGCQQACLLFWKDEWLKPIQRGASGEFVQIAAVAPAAASAAPSGAGCTEADLAAATVASVAPNGEITYACQATLLPQYTTELNWWNFSQYIEDFTSGNTSLWRIFSGAVYSIYYSISHAGIGLGKPMEWFYDTFHPLWGGTKFPRKTGRIPEGQPTPTGILNLQPGELVRVKSHDEILNTLNPLNMNRGLYFDAEEVPYCGKTYQVLSRVTNIIDEKTGKMMKMGSPCIILDKVVCESRYSECRMFCPRAIYTWWRENWLERVEPDVPAVPKS